MLPFSVTIPATVPQWSEIPEGLMNYPILKEENCKYVEKKTVPMPLFPSQTHMKIQFNYPYTATESNTLHFQPLT